MVGTSVGFVTQQKRDASILESFMRCWRVVRAFLAEEEEAEAL